MKTKTLATLVIAAFATVACTNNKTMESGIKLENLDTKAVPGDDFFRYACGSISVRKRLRFSTAKPASGAV